MAVTRTFNYKPVETMLVEGQFGLGLQFRQEVEITTVYEGGGRHTEVLKDLGFETSDKRVYNSTQTRTYTVWENQNFKPNEEVAKQLAEKANKLQLTIWHLDSKHPFRTRGQAQNDIDFDNNRVVDKRTGEYMELWRLAILAKDGEDALRKFKMDLEEDGHFEIDDAAKTINYIPESVLNAQQNVNAATEEELQAILATAGSTN